MYKYQKKNNNLVIFSISAFNYKIIIFIYFIFLFIYIENIHFYM